MSQIQDTPDGVSPWQIASSFHSTETTSGTGPEKETFGDDENGGHFRWPSMTLNKQVYKGGDQIANDKVGGTLIAVICPNFFYI